jgi:biotin carboxyl carrier protein
MRITTAHHYFAHLNPRRLILPAIVLLAAAVIGVAVVLHQQWLPQAKDLIAAFWPGNDVAPAEAPVQPPSQSRQAHDDDHTDHEHDESTSLVLSAQARRNIGLSAENVGKVELKSFTRTMTFPAIVVERPGRTKIQVATPMTGVVTHVYAIKGEAVHPGRLLFKIRLTHEDLVQAQTTFLRTLEELDVEKREITRLEQFTQTGIIPGKRLLERQYEKQKLEAALSAQREALLLHGLSDAQIGQIEGQRRLLRELQVFAPSAEEGFDDIRLSRIPNTQVAALDPAAGSEMTREARPYVVQDLNVHKGQSVAAGESLCVLADFSELYVEGRAFEQDANQLVAAANRGWTVTAVVEGNQKQPQMIPGLKIVYLANQVDPESRALHFYVGLPNQIVRDEHTADGHWFIDWKFRPGQRLQVRVPVELWEDRIVLPVDAVAQEGAEYFVFRENGDHFDRRSVHVQYRDQFWVVVANDGSLFPGDRIALAGAHQMQMALKNKAGGGVDAHAGHTH